MVDLSVLMPCHNETRIIRHNIMVTRKVLEAAQVGSFEIIAIDDGSTDGTFQSMKECVKDFDNVKCLRIRANSGKGNALKEGFKLAKGELVAFLDGDLDLHPKLIKNFIDVLERTHADVVIGSKRHSESKVDYPSSRRLLSAIYHGIVKAIFNLDITDSQVGIKLFRRQVLENVLPRLLVKKFAFDLELLVNVSSFGYKIVEAPIEMDFVSVVGSDVNLRAIGRMLVDTCAIFYRKNILHYYNGRFKVKKKTGAVSEFKYPRSYNKST